MRLPISLAMRGRRFRLRRLWLRLALITWMPASPALLPTPAGLAAPTSAAQVPNPPRLARSQPDAGSGKPVAQSAGDSFDRNRYNPAILHITASRGKVEGQDAIDLVLTPPRGELVGRQVSVNLKDLGRLLRDLYGQLARQEPLDQQNPASPLRRLHQLLLEPIVPELERQGITTLLLVPDGGLQAVPYAALSDGTRSFGERYAFAITPSVTLMQREQRARPPGQRQLALGASHFESLSPLPLVPQELARISSADSRRYLNGAFTPDVLLREAGDPSVNWVHVATHAEFLPGGPSKARIYAGQIGRAHV